MKKIIIPFLILITLLAGSFYLYVVKSRDSQENTISDISDNTRQVSYQIPDLIIVKEPMGNSVVKSPLVVSGEARGLWFFEGSAPVRIVLADGSIIGSSNLTAGEWMTEEFVPYSGTVEFVVPLDADRGFVVINRANPSGLPENDQRLSIPVRF